MRKLTKSIFIIIITVLCVLYILQLNKNSRQKSRFEEKIIKKNEKLKNMSRAENQIFELNAATNKLNLQLKKQSIKFANLLSEKEQESIETSPKEENKQPDFTAGLADMMETPEMQDMMRVQLENTLVNPVYGNLIKEFNLNDMDSEVFRNLLTEKVMANYEAGMQMLKGVDKEKKEEIDNATREQKESVNSMIKELIGEENYEKYEDYQQTETERMMCSQFNNLLTTKGNNLTPEQNENLVDIMYEERKSEANFPEYIELESITPENLNEETLRKYLNQQEKINKRTSDRVQSILTVEQIKAFESFQFNLLRQQEAQMKMGMSMFKKNEKK